MFPYTFIFTPPHSFQYLYKKTYIRIFKQCQIREYVTINASVGEDTAVTIGDNCFLMAYCHVAHNCSLGTGVVMANNATLAGHVDIGDYAIIGGMTPIHQFVRIGKYAMVGGFSRVPQDVPPYTLGAGVPYRFGGLNLRGLKRHGFPMETRNAIFRAFRLIFRSDLSLEDALKSIEETIPPLPEVKEFANFCRESKRGIIALHSKTHQAQEILTSG
ncbi:MAG: acyl-ACP--UDP-N-acetylglucosamine O-acyltransferase [Chlamydiia bacterium]|nr:acyl-ACP--UDP-N-acetylglucosamine O-acyltransferase [Chlamydiia bacterium]